MKIHLLIFILISFFVVNGRTTISRTYYGDDFFIDTLSDETPKFLLNSALEKKIPINCREHIKTVMCLVDPIKNPEDPTKPGDLPLNRPCLSGSEKYAIYFEELYDNYPLALQKMFCSLKVIYIEKEFFGTAYAGLIKDEKGATLGAQVGIRKSVLDENLNLTNWATWKEQLSFGGTKTSYNPTLTFPRIISSSNTPALNDLLYFVITHEFGHIFDFANNLNKTTSCINEGTDKEECQMDENSWGGISWISSKKVKPLNEFAHRTELCFYWCDGKNLDPALAPQIYPNLYNTDFISIYATTQPWDDFADSLAYFMMNQNLNTKYQIETSNSLNFDIMTKLKSQIWFNKYNYIENFINKKEIIYP